MNPTFLFGKKKTIGNNKCYYCGNACSDFYRSKDHVKKTFTNRDIVSNKNSEYVCENCVSSFSDKKYSVKLCGGEVREDQNVRTYSWCITIEENIAYTKAHLNQLRQLLLNPPKPPFIIVLSDSGQKHLIFRSKISLQPDNFPVSLEDEIIYVDKKVLGEYMDLLIPFVVVCGKPCLKKYQDNMQAISIKMFEVFENAESLIEKLYNVKNQQLFKLAVWLSYNKEECNELLESGKFQREDFKFKESGDEGRADKRIDKDGSCPTLF